MPFKDSIHEPNIKKSVRKSEVNAILQHVVDDILQENKDKIIGAACDISDYFEHDKIGYGI